MSHDVIPAHLSIRAMRSSGYKDAAHAVAELIDNSIQAGFTTNDRTEIEVICLDKPTLVKQQYRRQLSNVAVYDNAHGMSPETLRMALQFGAGTHLEPKNQTGIGKFGMGLPNASISQCRRVDVWSWQGGRVYHTYLDVTQIEQGQMTHVPEPQPTSLPQNWLSLIRNTPNDHGTLVVWSQLDRIKWKRSDSFLRHAEFLVGRMYRYFLHNNDVRIRLAAYEEIDSNCNVKSNIDYDARPNDPLYLMENTNTPPPYDNKPAFDLLDEETIEVGHKGQTHYIKLRFSICKEEVRKQGGNSQIGKHVRDNQGVSVVRANRELEMNHSFEVRYDPRERWWGVEVLFDPALDEIFGVTNNKQAATSFYIMDLESDADLENMSPGEYKEHLQENQDPRLVIYQISNVISQKLSTIRHQIARMRENERRKKRQLKGGDPAENIGTQAVKQRREKVGAHGESDQYEQSSEDQRISNLQDYLTEHGTPEEQSYAIAVSHVKSNIKFLFRKDRVSGPAFFDIQSRTGTIIIIISTNHPAYNHLFELLESQDTETEESPAFTALKLLLTAWARLEDEAQVMERKQMLEDIRIDWGRITRDFLQHVSED